MFVPDKSCLQFKGYRFNEIQFVMTSDFDANATFELAPSFTRTVSNQDDNVEVKLRMDIVSTSEKPAPFTLHISMVGEFLLTMPEDNEKLRSQLLNENTVAIMFPFLRSAVSTLTTTANFPPLLLPIINLASIFSDADSEE